MIDRTPVNDEILREHMEILFRNAPTIYITTLLNCLFVYFTLASHISSEFLFPWFFFLLLLILLRVLATHRFWQQTESFNRSLFYFYFYIVLMHFSAITWGMLVYLPLSDEFIWSHAFISFVIAGMSAGAMLTLSASLLASIPYLLLILVPFISYFLSIQTPIHNALGIMASLYLLLLLRMAHQINNMLRETTILKQQNEELYDFLKKTSKQSFLEFMDKIGRRNNSGK